MEIFDGSTKAKLPGLVIVIAMIVGEIVQLLLLPGWVCHSRILNG